MGEDYIICQIYKESRFKQFAGKNKHNAKGLMQMQRNAVRQVFKYRQQKIKGRMTTDKETMKLSLMLIHFINLIKYLMKKKILRLAQSICNTG